MRHIFEGRINKNLNCALRLGPLRATFPDALFLGIHRNEVDNAHSLLEARMNINKCYETWLSMEPAAH